MEIKYKSATAGFAMILSLSSLQIHVKISKDPLSSLKKIQVLEKLFKLYKIFYYMNINMYKCFSHLFTACV